MIDVRTLLLGVAAFSATFAGGLWLGVGNLPKAIASSAADVQMPGAAAQTPRVAAQAVSAAVAASRRRRAQRPAAQGQGLMGDDRMRHAVSSTVKVRSQSRLQRHSESPPKRRIRLRRRR
jgi:hypothetical protein